MKRVAAMALASCCFACAAPEALSPEALAPEIGKSEVGTVKILSLEPTKDASPSARGLKPISDVSIEVAQDVGDLNDPAQREAWRRFDFGMSSFDWIGLRNLESELPFLRARDEIVLPATEATLIVDSYLRRNAKVMIRTTNANGFTREGLLRAIREAFRRIYQMEEQTLTIPVIPVEKRQRVLNRNETDGVFGIWGHDFDDLAIHQIHVFRESGVFLIDLDVYS